VLMWMLSFVSPQKLNINNSTVLYHKWFKKETNWIRFKLLKMRLIVNKNIRRVNRERAVLDVYQS